MPNNKIALVPAFLVMLISIVSFAQPSDPWTKDQIMEPAALAAIIKDTTARQPTIICVGPGAIIRHSIDAGPARDNANLQKLRQQLEKLPKDATVVIYCGCCPFDRCPNIRPAFRLLKEMKFTHARLLNLATNIKVDWIDKGYPATN
jgi:hypothetical protein